MYNTTIYQRKIWKHSVIESLKRSPTYTWAKWSSLYLLLQLRCDMLFIALFSYCIISKKWLECVVLVLACYFKICIYKKFEFKINLELWHVMEHVMHLWLETKYHTKDTFKCKNPLSLHGNTGDSIVNSMKYLSLYINSEICSLNQCA